MRTIEEKMAAVEASVAKRLQRRKNKALTVMGKNAVSWYIRISNRTDHERAKATAKKFDTALRMWEVIRRSEGSWIDSVRMAELLKINRRMARRYMLVLGQTAFCQVRIPRRGYGRMDIRMRFIPVVTRK